MAPSQSATFPPRSTQSLTVRAFLMRHFLHARLSSHTVDNAPFIRSQLAPTIKAVCESNEVVEHPRLWVQRKFHSPLCGWGFLFWPPALQPRPRTIESDMSRAFLKKKPGFDSAIPGLMWYLAYAMAVDIQTEQIGATGSYYMWL